MWSCSAKLGTTTDFHVLLLPQKHFRTGARWNWALTLLFCTDMCQKCDLCLPLYCVGRSARPQYQTAISISFNPILPTFSLPYYFFSQWRNEWTLWGAKFSTVDFLSLPTEKPGLADPFTKCCLCSRCVLGYFFGFFFLKEALSVLCTLAKLVLILPVWNRKVNWKVSVEFGWSLWVDLLVEISQWYFIVKIFLQVCDMVRILQAAFVKSCC